MLYTSYEDGRLEVRKNAMGRREKVICVPVWLHAAAEGGADGAAVLPAPSPSSSSTPPAQGVHGSGAETENNSRLKNTY
jgi:hypothetical protein